MPTPAELETLKTVITEIHAKLTEYKDSRYYTMTSQQKKHVIGEMILAAIATCGLMTLIPLLPAMGHGSATRNCDLTHKKLAITKATKNALDYVINKAEPPICQIRDLTAVQSENISTDGTQSEYRIHIKPSITEFNTLGNCVTAIAEILEQAYKENCQLEGKPYETLEQLVENMRSASSNSDIFTFFRDTSKAQKTGALGEALVSCYQLLLDSPLDASEHLLRSKTQHTFSTA